MILLLAVAPSRYHPPLPGGQTLHLLTLTTPRLILSTLPSFSPTFHFAHRSLCFAPQSFIVDETSRSISRLSLLSASTNQVSRTKEEISGDPTQNEREASGESRGKQHIMTFHKLLHLLLSVSLCLSIALYLEFSGSITIQ